MYVMCWLIKWGDHAIVSWCLDASCPLSRYQGLNDCSSFHEQTARNHYSAKSPWCRFSTCFINRCNHFCIFPSLCDDWSLQSLVFSLVHPVPFTITFTLVSYSLWRGVGFLVIMASTSDASQDAGTNPLSQSHSFRFWVREAVRRR